MEWQQQYIENQLTMNAITEDPKTSRQCAMNLMIQMQPGTSIFVFLGNMHNQIRGNGNNVLKSL